MAKVVKEQKDIFSDDLDQTVTSEHLTKMKYLDCCIKETLRLYPSVPIVGRNIEKDTYIDGQYIPKGTSIMILIQTLNLICFCFSTACACVCRCSWICSWTGSCSCSCPASCLGTRTATSFLRGRLLAGRCCDRTWPSALSSRGPRTSSRPTRPWRPRRHACRQINT